MKALTRKQFEAMKAHLDEHDLWDQLYGEMAEHIEAVGFYAAPGSDGKPVTRKQTIADVNASESEYFRSTNGWDPRGEIPTEDEVRDDTLPEMDLDSRPDNRGGF